MRNEPVAVQLDPLIPGAIWLEMLPLARQFWIAVSQNVQISEGFRHLARQMHHNFDEVETQIRRYA